MKIHFIGIGGIGVSALARYYLAAGHAISGSDLTQSEITDELAALGADIKIGRHAKSRLASDIDRVIYTAAVPEKNPELKAARERNIPVQSYAEALGELTREYKTITISGSHGKSTTTALAALILEEGYCDPTVIIGTKLKEFGGSNFRKGRGTHLLLEADEWNRSLLNYSPHIAVVTNIDVEHLDTYKNVEAIEDTFREYLAKVPKDGKIIANADDERLHKVAQKFGKKVVWYSLDDRCATQVKKILKIPGQHNLSNALGALALGRVLGINESAALKALSHYTGAWRRFEFMGMREGAFVYADYGHHPREIAATLAGAREKFPYRRVWCVYQPHQYQRLQYLWDDFVGAFDHADRVVLLPVYAVAGREKEKIKPLHTSKRLADELATRGKNTNYCASFDAAKEFLASELHSGDIALFMGAGDVYDLTKDFLSD